MPGIAQPPASSVGTRYSTSQLRFGSAAAGEAAQFGAGSLAFWLLILFFIVLYSNLALLVPALAVLHPALAVGGLALVALLFEKASGRQSIEIIRPDTYFLFGFVAVAGLSISGAFWQGYAFAATLDLAKAAVVYLLILNAVNSQRRLRGLMWAMLLCGLFPALGTLRNWHNGVLVDGRAAWTGIFGNPNELAYALVILLPIGYVLAGDLPPIRRLATYGVLGVFTLAIYLSYSRGSLLGLFAVVGYMALRQKSRTVPVVMIALLIAGAMGVATYWSRDAGFSELARDASFQQRLDTYKTALRMVADHPLLGVGINCSSVAWPFYAPRGIHYNTWLITHNTVLQAASETGIAGLIAYLLFLGAAWRRAWKVSRSSRPDQQPSCSLGAPKNYEKRAAPTSLGQNALTPDTWHLTPFSGQRRVPGPRAGRARVWPRSQTSAGRLMMALEVSLVGFLVCGLSGGYVMSWFPYLLTGLIAAGGKIVEQPAE